MMRFLLLWAELLFGLVLSWRCVKSVLFVCVTFHTQNKWISCLNAVYILLKFQCKKTYIYIYPKSSPPSRARAHESVWAAPCISLFLSSSDLCWDQLALWLLWLCATPSPPASGEYFCKAECERVAWSAPLQTLLKLFTLNRVMRVDTSGFWEPYRLHSSFVGVTRSWTLARADRETDLHRDLLAPLLYLENPVRAPAASR